MRMAVDQALAANRANWDERVPSHLVAYGVDEFVTDPRRLTPVMQEDLALLAPHLPGSTPAGRSVVHLQCHLGLDTLSWARCGAAATGIDFSPAAIEAARGIGDRAGVPARFIVSDVDNAARVCGERYDIVYTGVGALCWLPDLDAWAHTIADLLRPGGVFYVRDAHPMLATVDQGRSSRELVVTQPYFGTGTPLRYEDGTTYADDRVRLSNAVTFEWPHSMSEIIQSLLDAGLTLTSLAEHRHMPWQALPDMVRTERGWALPEHRERLPLTFSLVATKPA
ncbi:class I SAM-dependent methyltransferase [Micromonospora sp. NBC_01796]|uniref:class I SAM-dependent methyltransferase n=1 Tax=Micromonospora sp. NBC_01796 TaxID=2975987 RepID=UPI002DDABAF2|nr:class I SAM-dependent methyltransferase [Micromonospora sp. NBC_01796]WSA85742.1 class I SAM-dependent methyltransferase [Micromonospora sp. NBC_01796]